MKMNTLTGSILLSSVLVALMSKSWFMVWLMMEINMVGMSIQLMSENSKENLIMFFVFQTMPSMAVLVYLLMTGSTTEHMISPMETILILLAMVSKVGMFPLQKWALKMSKSMSWDNNVIMMTWQKMIPLLVLMKMKWSLSYFMIPILSMLMLCGIMMGSTSMKPFLMSSSIIHVSWMFMAMNPLKIMSMVYLIVYSTISLMLVKNLKLSNKKMMNEQMKKIITSTKMLMLSLSGMPPTVGFMIKISAISMMMLSMTTKKMISMVLMVATMAFYCYLQMLWKSMIMMKPTEKNNKNLKKEKPMKVIYTNIICMPIMFML